MTKKLFFFIAALVASGMALADNIAVNTVTVPKGGTATVEVELNNPDHEFTAFQMALQLPDGISGIKDERDRLILVNGNRFDDQIVSSSIIEGGFQFACLSNTSSAIIGKNGMLFSFDVMADVALEVGTELTAKFTGIAFTTTGKAMEVEMDDVSFKITIVEPDDGRIKFDEAATKLPKYTAGDKGDVTLKRTIKAGTWSTIVLPFNLTRTNATAIFGSDVEFAKFSGFEVDYGNDEENITPLCITVNFTSYSIPARGNLAGGTPVLIKTSKDINEIVLDQVTLTEGVKDEETADEYGTAGKFTGSLIKTTVPADGLFLNSNKFYYSTGKTNIKAFRGWFELGAVLNQETDFGVKMVIDGFETNVEGVSVKDAAGNVYDLSGRKVSKAGKGVYIVNGKKVLVN